MTSGGKGAKVYEQAKTVADKPNPPRTGTQWQWNNRPEGEGYADYRVGMFYVSCFQVMVERDCEAEAGGAAAGEGQARERHRMRQNMGAASGGREQQQQGAAAKESRTSFQRLAQTNTVSTHTL